MSILYLLSMILLFVMLMLCKKSDKKESPIIWAVINICLVFIINSLIIYFINLFNIRALLLYRSIFMIIISLTIGYFIHKAKKIQKYKLTTSEGIVALLFLISTIIIWNYRFTNQNDLIFETTDPASHFMVARNFADCNLVSEKSNGDLIYGKSDETSLFLSYTSLGSIFQIVGDFDSSSIAKVNSFIFFEMIILFFTMILLYYIPLLFYKKEKKVHRKIIDNILLVTAIILCCLGYPFNNLIFGYHYLGISILITLILFYLIEIINFKKWNNYLISYIILFSFSIFTTYYMFVPVVFGSCGLFFLYRWYIKKEIDFKTTVKYILISLCISFFVGLYMYILSKYLFADNSTSLGLSPFVQEGYIYRNFLGNIFIVLVFACYSIYNHFKEKSINIFDISVIMILLFMVLVASQIYYGDFGTYYYYKNYYMLWPILFIIITIGIAQKNKETHGFSVTTLLVILLLVIFQNTNFEGKLTEKNVLLNPVGFVNQLTDIYWFNNIKSEGQYRKPIYTAQELKELEEIMKNEKIDNNLVLYGELLQKLWFYNLYYDVPTYGMQVLADFYADNPKVEDVVGNENIKYIIVMKRNNELDMSEFNKLKAIYDSENIIVYEK